LHFIMKYIKYFICFILITCFLASCSDNNVDSVPLNQSTKDFFNIKNGSKYQFVSMLDTNTVSAYTVENYNNLFSNPDISNNEIIFYDMKSLNNPTFTIRAEAGNTKFNDRITLLTRKNDSIFVGPICFNTSGTFSAVLDSKDTLTNIASIIFGNTSYTDVIKIAPFNHPLYKEIYYAKGFGLIARKERNDAFYYSKNNQIIN